MKQPNDEKTIELELHTKRGRGRPALASALSQAERARRYRAKRKSEGVKSDVTENEERQIFIEWEQERLRDMDREITEQSEYIQELKNALEACLTARSNKKRLPDIFAEEYLKLIK